MQGSGRLLSELDSVKLKDRLEPDHGPLDIPTVFNLRCKELEKLQKEHLGHMSNDKLHRCTWDASVDRVSHFSYV